MSNILYYGNPESVRSGISISEYNPYKHIVIDAEDIKLHKKDIGIEIELDSSVLDNIESIEINGHRFRKELKGAWVRQEGRPEAICSNCGREVVYKIVDNRWRFEDYCPGCGFKMEVET